MFKIIGFIKICKRVITIFLEISQENTCATVSFLIKLQTRPATLLKKKLWHRCFSVNSAKFLRTPFLQNTSGRLLLELWFLYQEMFLSQASFCRIHISIIQDWWYAVIHLSCFDTGENLEADLNASHVGMKAFDSFRLTRFLVYELTISFWMIYFVLFFI